MKRAENCLYNLQETTQLEHKSGATATSYLTLQNLETLVTFPVYLRVPTEVMETALKHQQNSNT